MKPILFFSLLSNVFITPAYSTFAPMLDETAMDLSADPCEDFAQYACGNWYAQTAIPADKPSIYRSFTSIDEENLKINRQLLEDFSAGKNLTLTPDTKKLGEFYASCMDTAKIIAHTSEFLDKKFEVINKLNRDNIGQIIADLHKQGIPVFFNFNPEQDFKNSSQMIASLDQGGLGLPSSDYYLDTTHAATREKYILHVAKMLELSGISEKEALKNAHAIMKFETSLARASLKPVERRDPNQVYHIKSMNELKEIAPHIKWDEFFDAVGAPKFSSLNVAVPKFFTNLNEVLADTPTQDLKTYLRWNILSAYSMDLDGEFAKENFRFFGTTLKGQKEMKPRWQYCVSKTDNALVDALGRAFVVKTFGPDSKTKALAILDSIQKVYEENLNQLDWMDTPTRKYAIKKLHAFMKKIGYPDSWRDLSKMHINNNYMHNVNAAAKFASKWEMGKINKAVDRSEWLMTPDTVNAYYNPSNNEIVFPAGILQSPFFLNSAPMAANYGAFGAVIGHEITHGFDDEGREFDLNGNLKDWWTPQVGKVFLEKAQCLVDQYSKYTIADGTHLDGKLTLGENIADLGGLKMALAALNASLPSNLTTADRLAEEKKFFVSFGQIWCSKSTPQLEKLYATTDPHSPPKFRINGVLTNVPEFAKTFNCKENTPLAPIQRCTIW